MIIRLAQTLFVFLLLCPHGAWAEEENVELLVSALTSGTEGARCRAANRLFLIDEADRGVPSLTRQLQHEDPNERALAARILGLLQSEMGTSALIRALSDDDWAVRRDAAEALGQIGARTAAPVLERLLEDSHPRVRIAAVRSLAEIERPARLPAALGAERVPEVRLHIIEALGLQRSPASRRALLRALNDDIESVRTLAAGYLVERGEPRGLAVLVTRMSSDSTTVRLETVEALHRATGAATAPAHRILVETLSDPEPSVGLAAAAALAAAGDSRGATHLRGVAIGHEQAAVRARALELLLELSPSE